MHVFGSLDQTANYLVSMVTAISLSLSGSMNSGVNLSRASDIDMSYEVRLEHSHYPSVIMGWILNITTHILEPGDARECEMYCSSFISKLSYWSHLQEG